MMVTWLRDVTTKALAKWSTTY